MCGERHWAKISGSACVAKYCAPARLLVRIITLVVGKHTMGASQCIFLHLIMALRPLPGGAAVGSSAWMPCRHGSRNTFASQQIRRVARYRFAMLCLSWMLVGITVWSSGFRLCELSFFLSVFGLYHRQVELPKRT